MNRLILIPLLLFVLAGCVSDQMTPTPAPPHGSGPHAQTIATFRATADASGLTFVVEPAPQRKDSACPLRVAARPGPRVVLLETERIAHTPEECEVPNAPPFTEAGVYCAYVSVVNPTDEALPEVSAVIDQAVPGLGAMPWRAPWVNTQEPDGFFAPTSHGQFRYGTIEPERSETAPWRFQSSAGPFTFRGRIVAEFPELPDNGIDDDCDGEIDEPE